MLKYNKYNLTLKHMIFLNNFKKSFSFFLFSSLVENWPTWWQESNSSIEQTRNLERQNLTPEQQEISDKIDSLQKKYETLITSEKITKAVADRLLAWLTSDPEIQNDPEAKPTIDMFNRYRAMFENASSEWTEVKLQLAELKSLLSRASNALEYAAWVEFDSSTWEIKEMSLEKEKLKTITNKEFLALPKEERLQYITKDNIDSEYVSNWSVNELEFNFTFDWVFNREFYMYTTAWQVLPKEVSEVKVWGETYIRKNIWWEFFTPNNNRLTIHDWTKIEILELRTPEQLESISQENDLKVREFLEKNPGSNEALVSSAISRWIEPDFAKLAFSWLIEWKSEKEASLLIEDAMTEFDRYRGQLEYWLELDNWKYENSLWIYLLKKFNLSNWKDIATEYWYEEQEINSYNEVLKTSIDFSSIEFSDVDSMIDIVSNQLGINSALIKSIIAQESSWNMSATRFEQHVYYREIRKWASQSEARLLATSFWWFQIMGFNYKVCWYNSVESFVEAMKSPRNQFEAFSRFISATPALINSMRKNPPDFQKIAYFYNWPLYAQNNYDNKIRERYNRYLS